MLNSDNALPTCGELCGMRDTSNPTDGSKIIDTLMAGIPATYYNSSDDIHYLFMPYQRASSRNDMAGYYIAASYHKILWGTWSGSEDDPYFIIDATYSLTDN